MTSRADVEQLVLDHLADAEIEHERGGRPGEVVATLPGEHKLRTTVSLLVGEHSLSASAFVVRNPDENHAEVHRWLLRRNSRLQGIAFAVDADGDVYLVGRLPLDAVTPQSLDGLLGAILSTADGSFDTVLAMGFLTSMKREWAWRTSRGESTRNLEAFRHLLEDPPPA
ncbi:MAG TPA: YbjN domain-containing protein [Actinomycetales bacterium]|nr:YbjN domain-containing protein [Actinomycetales bacterium]